MDKSMFVLLVIILTLIMRCIYLELLNKELHVRLKEAWKNILNKNEGDG